MSKKEIIEKIKQVGFYNFLAENYWKLTKEDLADIGKELAYKIVGYEEMFPNDHIFDEVIENLEDSWSYDLEEDE